MGLGQVAQCILDNLLREFLVGKGASPSTSRSFGEYSFSLLLHRARYLWPFCGQSSHKLPLLATISWVSERTLRVS